MSPRSRHHALVGLDRNGLVGLGLLLAGCLGGEGSDPARPDAQAVATADASSATDLGAPARDLGRPDPDLGPLDPDLGPRPHDLGPAEPDLGPADPDLGPADPDLGPGHPDLGPADPDLGPADPDLGSPDPPCPAGVVCVAALPFSEAADSRLFASRRFASYSCRPGTDESGPERIYRLPVPTAGFLAATIEEEAGVDVDVHLLSALDEAACLARGNFHAAHDVTPGFVYLVVDTYVADGVEQAGPFTVRAGLTVPSVGPCALQAGTMPRVGDGGSSLVMPATGPVVLEAHLVTQEEDYRPSSSREHLAEHYRLSEETTGFVMHRDETWAPLEGGDFYGCGIGSPDLFPVLHEGWYVNMYWTAAARPARGTRMILRLPGTSRAVVVAAGYETGPGDLAAIGGTTEETHFYLGTGHRSTLTLGIAAVQELPYGPRRCTD
ncbi:MAG: hypothetical protein RBU45_11410 [Myxococcota bacterium]|jgi:hypothetical protein|nr:hypothetical protein [Myxococcota bacterium]